MGALSRSPPALRAASPPLTCRRTDQVGVSRVPQVLTRAPAQPSGTIEVPTLDDDGLHLELALWRGDDQLACVLQDLNVLR